MTRLLLTLLVIAFVPLFSSPVFAEQWTVELTYNLKGSDLVGGEVIGRWSVENHPLCANPKGWNLEAINQRWAAKLHRDDLNYQLGLFALNESDRVDKKVEEVVERLLREIQATRSDYEYRIWCYPLKPKDELDKLVDWSYL